ncbi:MAG: epoxyqueuosine reductase, partial [Novosphingobium sp. 16-62-11]
MVNSAVASLEERLKAEAARLGFAACGFAPAADDPVRAQRLETWLGEGHHGTMEWMETRLHHRRGPQSLWPEAQSVIALGMSYAPAADPRALEAHPDRARISVYAQGGDYHDVVKRNLKA